MKELTNLKAHCIVQIYIEHCSIIHYSSQFSSNAIIFLTTESTKWKTQRNTENFLRVSLCKISAFSVVRKKRRFLQNNNQRSYKFCSSQNSASTLATCFTPSMVEDLLSQLAPIRLQNSSSAGFVEVV